MKVSLRVDASFGIGTGHVMRCLNLADELRAQGAECMFVSSMIPGNAVEHILQCGYQVATLPDTSGSTGFDWRLDLANTVAALNGNTSDWLVVDHYEIDENWENATAGVATKIMVIDDLANRAHHCDLLLDGNIVRDKAEYLSLVPQNCTLLVGRDYLLLDPACFQSGGQARSGTIVFLGGGDNQSDLNWFIPTLGQNAWPQPITVVLGSAQPHAQQLADLCRQHNCECLVAPPNFKRLCAKAAIAVVRCGLVSYELAALKTPSFCLWKPGIHQEVAEALEREGFVRAIDIRRLRENGLQQDDIHSVENIKLEKSFQMVPGTQVVAQQMMRDLKGIS